MKQKLKLGFLFLAGIWLIATISIRFIMPRYDLWSLKSHFQELNEDSKRLSMGILDPDLVFQRACIDWDWSEGRCANALKQWEVEKAERKKLTQP